MNPEHNTGSPTPFGFLMAIGGGMVAQATPTTPVGMAGLIVSITGLLMAGFQYFKVWMDHRNRDREIEAQNVEIQSLRDEIRKARENRHADANRFGGQISVLELKLYEADVRYARLEGKLGITDVTHAKAINANSENIVAVAEQTGTQLPLDSPHIEPVNGQETP